MLNPGVLLDEDPLAHLRHLKTAPPVEEEVDRCVECGYCEPVCPSRDLTITPRQRIVLRREIGAAAAGRGHARWSRSWSGTTTTRPCDTCAVDGMCQTACPVQIDTGTSCGGCATADAGPRRQRGLERRREALGRRHPGRRRWR